eukprot:TRINITY_DN4682_c0_g1_i2.p1 TRINITY_DN4682_c0_g1~~TRINITY_DN4682_c0_g1_i2.p1  ORF type:complete len:418 (+),score=56.34 TRINITY_DN4682_c0_g1_i2:90-1256(+)
METVDSTEAEGVRPFDCIHRVHWWCAQKLISSTHGSLCPSCRAPAIVDDPADVGPRRPRASGALLKPGEPSTVWSCRSEEHPLTFRDVATDSKLEIVQKAYVHRGSDALSFVSLVECVNAFLVHEGMETCTKLALLYELYNLADTSLQLESSRMTLRLPKPAVVVLDPETLAHVSSWVKRKQDIERELERRAQLEESRAQQDRLLLQRRVSELRAAAEERREQAARLRAERTRPPTGIRDARRVARPLSYSSRSDDGIRDARQVVRPLSYSSRSDEDGDTQRAPTLNPAFAARTLPSPAQVAAPQRADAPPVLANSSQRDVHAGKLRSVAQAEQKGNKRQRSPSVAASSSSSSATFEVVGAPSNSSSTSSSSSSSSSSEEEQEEEGDR